MGSNAVRKKKLFFTKPRRENTDKLTIYAISQIFNQLVWFKELVMSMYAFVGANQTAKVDAIFLCIRQVIDSMLQSIMIDRHDYELQVNRITEGLKKLDISIEQISIKSLYPRLIKLDLVINSPPKELVLLGIQTILEGIINEPLRLVVDTPKGTQTKIKVYSSNAFKVSHGVAYVGKDGNKVSGDSFMFEEFTNGQTCVAISDGMGNGDLAHEESSQALKVIKGFLSFDFSVAEAIQALQLLKSSANTDERFFSLDTCIIDRERQKATFYKKGATPSFIIRKDDIIEVRLDQLPIGVVVDKDVDFVKIDLEESDLIVMCSDGIFEQYPNLDELKKVLLANHTLVPKMFSKKLLHQTIEKGKGKIKDDMMVVAIKYEKQAVLQRCV